MNTEDARTAWKEEVKREELRAARKAGREAERKKFYDKGRIRAFIDAANFFIGRERPDIAADLLKHFGVTAGDARERGLSDFDLGRAGKLLE
jgi:hypothetical protein